MRGKDAGCTIVVKYGMKRDFNKWLATLGPTAPVKTLTELREWNLAHQKEGAIRYGQSRLDISDEVDLEKDRPRYEADSAQGHRGDDDERHRRGDEEVPARCDPVPGLERRGTQRRGPDIRRVIVPFAMVPNEPTPPFPGGLQRQAAARTA